LGERGEVEGFGAVPGHEIEGGGSDLLLPKSGADFSGSRHSEYTFTTYARLEAAF
jgi:hypothetical protein